MTAAAPPAVEGEFLAAYAAGDWPRAVAMVADHWTTLVFSQATYEQLWETLNSAPEEVLRRAPKAALIAEVIGRLPGGSVPVVVPAGEARIDQVLRDGTARDLVELAVLSMVARRAGGLPLEAYEIALASRPLLRAAATTRFSVAADLAAYWHLQAGQAALHAGHLEQAVLDLRQAWTFRAGDVTGYVAPSTAPFLALLTTLAGEQADAARWLDEVDRIAPDGRALIEWDTMERPAVVARLLAATDRLDVAAGRPLVEALLPQLSFDETWPVTLHAIVRHLVVAGEVDRAEQMIDGVLDLHSTAPTSGSMHGALVALARAEVALALGRAAGARRLLGGDAALVPGLSSEYAVRVELAADDLPAARRLAVVAEHQGGSARTADEAGLVRTAVDLASGAPAPGRAPLPAHLRRTAALLAPALHDALRAAYDDVPPVLDGVATGAPAVKLTPGEERVLEELRGDGGLPQVAERLYISRNTLKTHLRALYAKLGVSSREEAVALGARLGLVPEAGTTKARHPDG